MNVFEIFNKVGNAIKELEQVKEEMKNLRYQQMLEGEEAQADVCVVLRVNQVYHDVSVGGVFKNKADALAFIDEEKIHASRDIEFWTSEHQITKTIEVD